MSRHFHQAIHEFPGERSSGRSDQTIPPPARGRARRTGGRLLGVLAVAGAAGWLHAGEARAEDPFNSGYGGAEYVEPVPNTAEMRGFGMMAPVAPGPPIRPGVGLVLFRDLGETESAELKEDLATMAHLLAKRARSEPATRRAVPQSMGIPVVIHAETESTRPEALYLDGFGAVLTIPVDFPLLPPPGSDGSDRPEEQAPETPDPWEDAKRELEGIGRSFTAVEDPFGSPGAGSSETIPHVAGGRYVVDVGELAFTGRPWPGWSAERVERVQRSVTDALLHARNIRHLADADVIVVRVLGPEASRPAGIGFTATVPAQPGGGSGMNPFGSAGQSSFGVSGAPSRSVLNFRAAVSDLRRLEGEALDEAAFRDAVEIHSYREPR